MHDVNAVLVSLNWFAGCCSEPPGADTQLSRLQEEVVSRVAGSVFETESSIAIPSREAAFRELLFGRRCYEASGESGVKVARFTHAGAVSLPDGPEGTPRLSSALPADLRHYLEGRLERRLRPES